MIRICEHCEHCGESYRYAHTCPPPRAEPMHIDDYCDCQECAEATVAALKSKARLLTGKLRDVQRACVGLDELLREVEP